MFNYQYSCDTFPSLPSTRFPAWFTGYNLGTITPLTLAFLLKISGLQIVVSILIRLLCVLIDKLKRHWHMFFNSIAPNTYYCRNESYK